MSNDKQIEAVQGLISRLLPQHTQLFQLSIITSNIDVFELESTNNTITLRGNNGVSLASALHHYLKFYCNSQISWEADHINIPDPAPKVPKIHIETPNKYRYYMNTCTHGYSAVWWDWARWEREIDWMALHGINMPLAFTGQEKILQKVYNDLGVPTEDYFTGPAFLPWNRMGNLNGWAGPLSQEWIEKQFLLAKKILERERAFGMKPVLPSFNGYVPPQLKSKYPTSKIDQLQGWCGFPGTFYLNPLDPLFYTIGLKITQQVVSEFGTDHYYNVDPFNEEVPPTNETSYLSSVSKALYKPIVDADPSAIWIMQGWFLWNEADFWQPPQAKALLNAIPDDRLILLDLWAEEEPIWKKTDSFYGHTFVWNMLHNFGERPGMFGYFNRVQFDPYETRNQSKYMQGLGLAMEGIHQNPIMYDFLTDQVWRDTPVQLVSWVSDYTKRRYGNVTKGVQNAWSWLSQTVYDLKKHQFGAFEMMVGFRPSFRSFGQPMYDVKQFRENYGLFLRSGESLRNNNGYRYDLVDMTSQSLNDYASIVHDELITAYNASKVEEVSKHVKRLSEIIQDIDAILMTDKNFMLGPWLAAAKSWSTDPVQIRLSEKNARLQITSWGDAKNELAQYAYKMWGGLVSGFYAKRWDIFFKEIMSSLEQKRPFDHGKYEKESNEWDTVWVENTEIYLTEPIGDTYTISQKIHDKYF
jgi:alpha-N-acetylglucosaminidase